MNPSGDIEQTFAGLVRSFIGSFPPCRQAHARQVVYSWCSASIPTPLELRRAYWRDWYQVPEHRQKILERRREHYRQRVRQNFDPL